jgi:leader peptidase (prepilin peptidase)/N-methyltransferase
MTPTRAQLVFTVVISGVFGLLIGSFLNVVIYRVPRHLSVVRPGSHCPRCQHLLAPTDNIPVVSWLALRARCRYCGAPISVRYPAVELGNAAVFVAVSWALGPVGALVPLLVVAAGALAAVAIDIDRLAIPGPVLVTMAVGCGGLVVGSLAGEGYGRIGWAAIGAAADALGGLVLALLADRGHHGRPEDGPARGQPGGNARRIGSLAAVGWCAGWLWPPAIIVAVGGLGIVSATVALAWRGRLGQALLASAALSGLVAVILGGVNGGP